MEKRGISPVIAVVFLILMAVGISGLIYNFSRPFIQELSTDAELIDGLRKEELEIGSVDYNAELGVVTFWVRRGKSELTDLYAAQDFEGIPREFLQIILSTDGQTHISYNQTAMDPEGVKIYSVGIEGGFPARVPEKIEIYFGVEVAGKKITRDVPFVWKPVVEGEESS